MRVCLPAKTEIYSPNCAPHIHDRPHHQRARWVQMGQTAGPMTAPLVPLKLYNFPGERAHIAKRSSTKSDSKSYTNMVAAAPNRSPWRFCSEGVRRGGGSKQRRPSNAAGGLVLEIAHDVMIEWKESVRRGCPAWLWAFVDASRL